MNVKGQAFGWYGIMVLVELAAVVFMIMLLDNPIRSEILTMPATMGVTGFNSTITGTTNSYGAFPWIFFGCGFLALLIFALSRRQ